NSGIGSFGNQISDLYIGGTSDKPIQTYILVTEHKKCWLTKALSNADHEAISKNEFENGDRDLTATLTIGVRSKPCKIKCKWHKSSNSPQPRWSDLLAGPKRQG